MMTDGEKIEKAIDLGIAYGSIDGGHHKMWVIDQMLRILCGNGYKRLIKNFEDGEDGPRTYEWDEGIAP